LPPEDRADAGDDPRDRGGVVMPLTCRLLRFGCWGDHSANWPVIKLKDPEAIRKLSGSCSRKAGEVLPYGTYVLMDDRLRVETSELLIKLMRAAEMIFLPSTESVKVSLES
jgi:hypothetical protein